MRRRAQFTVVPLGNANVGLAEIEGEIVSVHEFPLGSENNFAHAQASLVTVLHNLITHAGVTPRAAAPVQRVGHGTGSTATPKDRRDCKQPFDEPASGVGLIVLDGQGKVLSLEALAADEIDLQFMVGDMSLCQLSDKLCQPRQTEPPTCTNSQLANQQPTGNTMGM